jgi:hypothetical protein
MLSDKYVIRWHQNIQCLPCTFTRFVNEKAWFKVALQRYLNTNSFYSTLKIHIPNFVHMVYLHVSYESQNTEQSFLYMH